LAYLLPLLAEGDRGRRRSVVRRRSVYARFCELFPQSFPLSSVGNLNTLKRCRKLNFVGSDSLIPFLGQVAKKASSGKNSALVAQWRALQADCASLDLVSPSALILAPTRELAMQVAAVASALGASCFAVVGGMDPERQRERLITDAPAIIVATPGRLRAFCGQLPSSTRRRLEETGAEQIEPVATVSLSAVTRLVLDEGDRLLDEGFDDDVQSLVCLAARRCQTMLFSATWSTRLESLAKVLRPSQVRVTVAGVPQAISQIIELVPKGSRGRRLRELLVSFGRAKVLVFVLFKREAKALSSMLASEGWNASALQGNMSQAARTRSLQGFRDAETAVLVATDVAARGLDVSSVTHVVNFSLGLSIDSYVHRIGRCGRAGR